MVAQGWVSQKHSGNQGHGLSLQGAHGACLSPGEREQPRRAGRPAAGVGVRVEGVRVEGNGGGGDGRGLRREEGESQAQSGAHVEVGQLQRVGWGGKTT